MPLTVAPSGKSASEPPLAERGGDRVRTPQRDATISAVDFGSSHVASPPEDSGETEEGITFSETASHLWTLRDQRDQVEMLVEAVKGLTFDLEAIVERRLLYGGDDDPHVYEDGYAVWAHFTDPPLPLVLYVPHQLADEFEQLGRDLWRGRGTVVGWDHRHRRLQVKLERPG
jgi:hypothetical protein